LDIGLEEVSFDDRLKQAIERGQQRGEARAHQLRSRALTEEELKRLHSQYRLDLSEHIESCITRLPNHFPGFQYETMFGDRGWGAPASRRPASVGNRTTVYSRLESPSPYSRRYVLG
jgi:hypothetical protein